MIITRVQDSLYFSVTAPCGCVWVGMRHTDDVRIINDRAMDHQCPKPDDTITDTMVLPDSVLSSITMTDKEYVSLSIEKDARSDLKSLQLLLQAEVGRALTISEVIMIAAQVVGATMADRQNLVAEADQMLRAAKDGGCE